MPDNVDKLYDALQADGAVKMGRDQFRKKLEDPANRKQLYDALRADGAVKGDQASFEGHLGYGTTQSEKPASQQGGNGGSPAATPGEVPNAVRQQDAAARGSSPSGGGGRSRESAPRRGIGAAAQESGGVVNPGSMLAAGQLGAVGSVPQQPQDQGKPQAQSQPQSKPRMVPSFNDASDVALINALNPPGTKDIESGQYNGAYSRYGDINAVSSWSPASPTRDWVPFNTRAWQSGAISHHFFSDGEVDAAAAAGFKASAELDNMSDADLSAFIRSHINAAKLGDMQAIVDVVAAENNIVAHELGYRNGREMNSVPGYRDWKLRISEFPRAYYYDQHMLTGKGDNPLFGKGMEIIEAAYMRDLNAGQVRSPQYYIDLVASNEELMKEFRSYCLARCKLESGTGHSNMQNIAWGEFTNALGNNAVTFGTTVKGSYEERNRYYTMLQEVGAVWDETNRAARISAASQWSGPIYSPDQSVANGIMAEISYRKSDPLGATINAALQKPNCRQWYSDRQAYYINLGLNPTEAQARARQDFEGVVTGEVINTLKPKSTVEYILTSALYNNVISQGLRAGVSMASDRGKLDAVQQAALEEYGKTQPWGAEALAEVSPFLVDMITGGLKPFNLMSGGAKNFVTRIAAEPGKRLLGLTTEAAIRRVEGNLGVRLLGSAFGGAAMLGTYSFTGNVFNQLAQTGDVNWGEAALQGVKSGISGAVFGIVGEGMGIATQGLSGAKALLGDAATVMVNGVAFTGMDALWSKEPITAETWAKNFGMALGFHVADIPKYARNLSARMRGELGPMRSVRLSDETYNQINGEYPMIADLLHDQSVATDLAKLMRDGNPNNERPSTESMRSYDPNDAETNEGLWGAMGRELEAMKADSRVPWSVVRNAEWVLNGKILPEPLAMGISMRQRDDGSWVGITVDQNGRTIDRFDLGKKEADANGWYEQMLNTTLRNQAAVADCMYRDKAIRESVGEAINNVKVEKADGLFYNQADFIEIYNKVQRGETLKESEAEYLNKVFEAADKSLLDNDLGSQVKAEILGRYGIDIDKLLESDPNKYSDKEREALSYYLDEIIGEELVDMSNPGMLNAGASGGGGGVPGELSSRITEIDNRVFSEEAGGDGKVHPVTLKGEGGGGYIISGRVEVTADGRIDTDNSDSFIIIVDENGKKISIDIHDIAEVGEVVERDALVQTAADEIRSQQEVVEQEVPEQGQDAAEQGNGTLTAEQEIEQRHQRIAELEEEKKQEEEQLAELKKENEELQRQIGKAKTTEEKQELLGSLTRNIERQTAIQEGIDAGEGEAEYQRQKIDALMQGGGTDQQGDVNGDVNAAPAAQYKTAPIDETVTIEGTNNLPVPKTDKTESIEVGGRYQVTDGEGTHEIEVLRDNGNGSVEINVDGEQHTMDVEQLKQMLGIGSGEVNGEFITDATDEAAAVQPPTEHHQISGIENEPFGSVTPRSGRQVDLYRQQEDKDGVRVTRVVGIRDGNTVSVPTAYFPMPDGYTIDEEYRPEGEVLGVKELREVADGASATIVVRDDTGIATYDVKLNKVEAMPMGDDGEADFASSTPEQGHRYIYEESGLPKAMADATVENGIKDAEAAIKKHAKKEPGAPKPDKIQEWRSKHAQWEAEGEHLRQEKEYWEKVKAVEHERQAQAAAERKAKDAEVAAQAQAEEAQRQAEELAKQQEQAERGAGAVHPAIAEKWGKAPKVEGYDNEITLANGEKIQGRYVMTESGAATPSHNALREFEKSEGFPVDENGNTVNDRDYERDKDAQNITRKMGDTYDSRAIQQVPVVSRDGVVLSGNGRTMAGELAASNNTDKAYINHLKKYGKQFGFSPEQVSSMQHPRVVFVPDADMPYTTDTFAKFNEQEMKGQSKTEQAVKLGKVVDDATFNQIVRAINDHETLGDFYNNTRAATEAINALRRAGALNEMQYAEMFDGDAVSGTGRQIIENMLIGKAFEGNPDVIRQLTEIKSLRQSVVTALNEITINKALGKEYSLEKELAQAVDLAYKARKAGYKENEPVSPYATQLNLFPFEDGETVADYNNVAVLELADLMNDKRPTQLKKKLQDYNQQSAESAAGQMDIFSGGVKEKKEIIKTVLNTLHNGETEEASRPEQRGSVADERGGEASLQENGAADESSAALATPQTGPSKDAAIVEAGKETNTEPTDAQKEAGNYKKGHVKIDGFDISIEQPKGSVRSGVDATGKAWSQKMNNTYGYIRGTEGVDGDHIDVFLSDNLDGWNGTVYVVDQVNKDGSFDEHKVMYGFNSEEEARKAYLSNYEDGWDGLGAITAVSKDEFKKWIDSSHRKTKPFAEYKNVKVGDLNAASVAQHKRMQMEIINQTNPMTDDVHTGIRSESDILTLEEAVEESLKEGERGGWATLSSYPDVPNEVLEEALRSGKIRVYSSDPIEDGVFVTPSRIQAEDYAGGDGSKVYEKEVPIEDVAWINTDEGQLARVRNSGDRGVVKEDAVKYETASRNTGRDIALDDRVSQREYLLSDNYVARLTGNEFAKSDTPLTERVAQFYTEKYGGKVEREGFGMVHLDKRGVKDSLSHGLGRNKAAAFAAVPSIIKDGALIDHKENFKGRNQDSYTLAAPVEIGDKGYVGVVIVTRGKGTDRNKFYLHEVILQKNLLSEEFKTGINTGSKQGENLHEESIKTDTKADSHQGDVAKILKEIVTAKESGEKVANERGSSYRSGSGDVIRFESHAEQLSLFNGGDVAMTSQRTERATERAKRVKEMSDAELLKEMQLDIAEFEKLGRGDWGIQTACTDEYDRRHIKEYNAECERVRTMLDENNVSIEEAEDMLCNAIYSWRDGFATADRSKLLAQFDTLNDYYAEKTDERDNADLYQEVESEQAISETDARNTETPTQQEVAPTTQQTESAKPTKTGFDPSAIKLRKLKGGETCHVERRYQESGGFDFTGSEKVESDADLAYIFRNLENSSIENTFLVLIKNGKATILHVGMGGYAFSAGHLGAGVLAASQLKPDSVIFVHNHPSGTLQPSQQDIAMQEKVKKMFGADKVREAIIIDITSGQYSVFDTDNTRGTIKQRPTSAENEVPYKTYSFSQQVFAKDYVPDSAFQITDSNKAAEFISGHRLGERDKLSLIVLNRQKRVTGNIFLPWTTLDDIDINKAAGVIAKFIHQMGGESGILYGSGTISRGTLSPLARAISNYEVHLDDFISVEGKSAYQYGAMEPEVEYEAVPRNTEQQPTEVAEDGVGYGEADDSGISDEELAGYDAGRYSFAESITQGLVDLALKNTHDQQLRLNAMREFGGNLAKLRKIMNKQKAYDKGTVDDIVRLARMVMGSGFFKDMSAYEVKRLLAAIKKGVGVEDLTPIANNVVDMLVQHQLRESKAMLHKLMQVRGRKVDARGVEVQAGLDIDGQRMMSALKDGMSLGEKGLETRINDCENRLDSQDETVKKNAVSEYQGLMLAKEYHDNILSGEEEEIVLRNEKRQEQEKIYDFRREPVLDDDGNAVLRLDGEPRTIERKTLKPEFKTNVTEENKRKRKDVEAAIEKIEQSIRESRMERVTAYSDFMSDVAGDVRASRERAAAWRAEQLKRVDEIHHNANSDLQDIDPKSQTKEKKFIPLFNPKNDLVRGLFMPLATFEKFMRFFGRRFHNGEGYLFDRYVRGMIDCEDKEWRSKRAAHEELDAKVTELFGKTKLGAKRHWSDLFELERKKKYPTIPVEYWDNGELVQESISQGEALSLYVWGKQKDAEAGLRRMGISEEDMETLKGQLNPKFVELADWVVSDFLPKRREYYNEVYERMFGAPMAAVENYFPIVRNSRDVEKPTDVAERDQRSTNASTITGSFIKRVRTAAALDIHTDFFDLLLKHLDDMEHIAAWAEFNRDLNTLRNYKRFKNRVSNMNSFEFGAGKDLWKAFDNCCAIVTGVYEGNAKSKLDKITLNINKGFTRGAIAFRINTALKQYLSLPAFWSDARIDDLVKYQTPIGNAMVWGWAMENVPGLSKRWQSRQVGDTRLMDTDLDWKLWRNKYMKYLERGGMWSNALVDSATCASGAKAVYETKKRRYLKIGYTEEQAEKKALQDAAIAYKGSQQESMGGFVSEMQVDRTFLNNMLTVFRNSPFSYGRKMTTGLRELKKRLRPGYKSDFIEAEATKMVREGIPEENAKKEARRLYRFGGLHALFDVFNYGYLLSFLWTVLGGSAWYLLFGKDDEEKEEIIKDGARRLWFSPLEGFTGGNTLSEKGGLLLKYAFDEDGADKALNDFVNWSWFTTPMEGETDNLMRDIRFDASRAWWDVLSLAVQCNLGFKPETFTDGLAAIADYCDGDPQTTKEALLCWMRVMQVPQSQVDKIYFDELGLTARDAQMLNAMSMADRYSRYKMRKNNPLSYIMHSETDEKVFEKYRKRFLDNMQERMEHMDDEQLGWNFENPNDSERRKAVGKVYAKGKGVQDSAGKKPASNWKPETRRSQLKYQRMRDYNDLAEDVLLDVAIDQAKNRGDGETEKALRDAKKELTEIKRGKHTKKINRPGLGEGSADDDKAIMEKLRARRKEILREYGIIQ